MLRYQMLVRQQAERAHPPYAPRTATCPRAATDACAELQAPGRHDAGAMGHPLRCVERESVVLAGGVVSARVNSRTQHRARDAGWLDVGYQRLEATAGHYVLDALELVSEGQARD